MRPTLTACAGFVLLPVGTARADDDRSVKPDQWQPREAAMQLAGQGGLSVRKITLAATPAILLRQAVSYGRRFR